MDKARRAGESSNSEADSPRFSSAQFDSLARTLDLKKRSQLKLLARRLRAPGATFAEYSEGVPSDRLEIRAQRATAVEVEIVVGPTRCSPASSRIPPRHPIAVGPTLDSDPRACWDGATLSALVRARDPTTSDGHRL